MNKIIIKKDGKKYFVRSNRDRIFTPNEWIRFFKVLRPKRQKLVFDALINTGMRINELRNVKKGDIDFDKNTILVKVTKGKNRERKIHISSEFSKRLAKYTKNINDNEYLPILSTPATNIALKNALIKAGIENPEDFSAHNIRKTSETWLYCLRIEPQTLFNHFGHEPDVAYNHYIKSEIRKFDYTKKIKARKILGNLYYF